MTTKLFSSKTSLLPVSPFVLYDKEILEYYPDINASEIEKLKLDLLVMTEILYNYRILVPEKLNECCKCKNSF
ncbi:MAG: hypothetical protein D4R64_18935 [Porphyromonadaceae bacterium]|nr:MAG: hypothetical protein D4R64_18935 [Porphyromonadaceae bacterium]